ncbi:putative 1-phosphatidylinositol-3-phosphate 5-kinase FAB1D [Acorus calamus]|uniref:1-phosphatidylinositol-3-phosphate 5-kinase n=1 Tax=Acorus calamus TaxID=4465 RepID=A0AAV9FAY6_ACOCL|nr:putative 1-phosphatidylinositol-3-phosphate 5-kinase FAB1D [Acorus calamus]
MLNSENGDGDLDTGQENCESGVTNHLKELLNGCSVEDIDTQQTNVNSNLSLSNSHPQLEETSSSKSLDNNGSDGEKTNLHDTTESVLDSINEPFASYNEGDETPPLYNIDKDPLIWIPPEPENKEDDMESVANNDDDDECGDGVKWGQPSSLSSEEESRSWVKEEREKAMELMKRDFRYVVRKFLLSEGIRFSEEDDESWLEIVASLSWEAAQLIKPGANEGRAMDPAVYVKVKCVASGSQSQSQLIRGLVFKKNAAHKHMPTKYKNPRLLLFLGLLGQRASGLSSFKIMEQENDHMKPITDMIEICHPNLVLVEKSVSRDVQECLLAKGITLVYDMKLGRLERLAQCTASQIVSSTDAAMNLKLKQVDSFYIEKFVEEHNSSSDGKNPSKTLMFFEGCPRPLGCTILLKGAPSDELKKVKRVVHFAVFAAYHLIHQTFFLIDQRANFSGMHNIQGNGFLREKKVASTGHDSGSSSSVSSLEGFSADKIAEHFSDITISDVFEDNGSYGRMPIHSDLGSDSFSNLGVNSHENDVFENDLQLTINDVPHSKKSQNLITQSIHPGSLLSSFPASSDKKPCDGEKEPHHGTCNGGEVEALHKDSMNGIRKHVSDIADGSSVVQMSQMDGSESVLDPKDILVLLSRRHEKSGTVCEQSHLSRIQFYRNFDVSLGRFLHDNLLNQRYICSACDEPPESHAYSYTHRNGKLIVLVKRLPPNQVLPGEAEGKLWMWTICLKCPLENGVPKPTRRVVMSTEARGLSFGKFLELSFSSRSPTSRICGHSLNRDCLRFFGLGSMVAMFRYSPVDVYMASMPPLIVEFNNPNGQEWLKNEAKNVQVKGERLFSEVANLLQKMMPISSISLSSQPTKPMGPVRELSEVEEMLKQEKYEFVGSLLKAINNNGSVGRRVFEILGLNRLNQELLLELYIWDRRLHYLLHSTRISNLTETATEEAHTNEDETSSIEHQDAGNLSELVNDPQINASSSSVMDHDAGSQTQVSYHVPEDPILDLGTATSNIFHTESAEILVMGISEGGGSSTSARNKLKTRISGHDVDTNFSNATVDHGLISLDNRDDGLHISESSEVVHGFPITSEAPRNSQSITDRELKVEELDNTVFSEQHPGITVSENSLSTKVEEGEDWIWTPFSEIRKAYRKDLHRGYSQKFEFIHSYSPLHLSPMDQLATQERARLHFPVGSDDNVVSVYEDEFTSIIACALAIYQDQYNSSEKEMGSGKGEPQKEFEKSQSFTYDSTTVPSFWSSMSSLDGGVHWPSVASLEELPTSTSESFFSGPLPSSEALHPEIQVGEKSSGKSRYSVVCKHAKQFYALRRQCCPSELSYISSLSRCKKWDAQGGKSKAFFAKTMDDRFIIKQIKRTELDSFIEFAPEYFGYISHCLKSGSQTCLAKILGVYQVTIRPTKNNRELKIDLIVMENVFFGRNISRQYDLKGATYSRFVTDSDDPKKVFLDENFIKDMGSSPFYVDGKTKHLLQRAVWNDTSFLTSINVMDYSLLLGVDKQRHELVFGIIDYLRQYTWDKQLETWVKSSLVVPKNVKPTVVSPIDYKKRLRAYMSQHFLTVPDGWSSNTYLDDQNNQSSLLSSTKQLEGSNGVIAPSNTV